MNYWHLRQTCRYLDAGGIIAYPTEAIYGLGCNPLDGDAVMRLLEIKQRSWRKGLILIASDVAQIEPFVQLDLIDVERTLLQVEPQQAVTWLLPADAAVPLWLRGDSTQLAIRLIRHPLAAELCRLWGGAIVSTSANISTHAPAQNPLHIRKTFGKQIDYILSGALGGASRPSQIRDALTGRVIRV